MKGSSYKWRSKPWKPCRGRAKEPNEHNKCPASEAGPRRRLPTGLVMGYRGSGSSGREKTKGLETVPQGCKQKNPRRRRFLQGPPERTRRNRRPARVGVVDADCQRVSDASALPPGDWHPPTGECQAALWPSVAPSCRKRSEPATRVPWLPARSDG